MIEQINYSLIALAALVSIASPGPATLAIMGLSMHQGRSYGLMLAAGILTGSLIWSTTAAFGLGAVMYANAWLFEFIRYAGAAYLIYLSYRSLRSAMASSQEQIAAVAVTSPGAAYIRGLLIHLTNPKAILFFGALYSLAIPDNTTALGLVSVIGFVGVISACIFLGYAMLFSVAQVRQWYVKSRRVFEIAFAALFGFVGLKILVTRFNN